MREKSFTTTLIINVKNVWQLLPTSVLQHGFEMIYDLLRSAYEFVDANCGVYTTTA